MSFKSQFTRFSHKVGAVTGHPGTFILAMLIVIAWAVSGPFFGFSETWQLVINTGTTIVTFLMVFLIQCTQNRDTEAMQMKLDELIRATEGAHLALLDIEKLDEEDFDMFRKKYSDLASKARASLDEGGADTDCPEFEVPHPGVSAKDSKIV